MTNTPIPTGTLSMKYINAHAGILIRMTTDPARRQRTLDRLVNMNSTDKARIKVRIEQILADN